MLCWFLLDNNVNQPCVYIYLLPLEPLSPYPIPPLQVTTEHQALLPVLYGSFPLAVCFPHGAYVGQSYSPNSSHSLLPLLCPQVFSFPHLHLYSCPANRFISTIFLDPICICVNNQCLFFSFWLNFTLYNKLWIHPPHYNSNMFFLWLSSIPLYICTTASLSVHLLMWTSGF